MSPKSNEQRPLDAILGLINLNKVQLKIIRGIYRIEGIRHPHMLQDSSKIPGFNTKLGDDHSHFSLMGHLPQDLYSTEQVSRLLGDAKIAKYIVKGPIHTTEQVDEFEEVDSGIAFPIGVLFNAGTNEGYVRNVGVQGIEHTVYLHLKCLGTYQ